MKTKLKTATNFIARHTVWILTGALALYFLQPGSAEVQTFLLIAFMESIALALSGIALYVYTRIPFTRFLHGDGESPDRYSEKAPVFSVLGYVFLGVHLLVGLSVLGVYIAQFAN